MRLKTLYLIGVLLFGASIPVMASVDKIIFFVRGYDRELVFETQDTYANKEMAQKYYAAFRAESPSIMFWTRLIAWGWFATLVMSIVVIRRGVQIPLRLQYIAAAGSAILLIFTILPALVFGRGWPPRPF